MQSPVRLGDPLALSGSRLLPNLTGIYSKSIDRELFVYLVVRPRSASLPIAGVLKFYRDGQQELVLKEALPAVDAEGKVQYLSKIGFDRLKPGNYELRVTLSNSNGTSTAVSKFRIDP